MNLLRPRLLVWAILAVAALAGCIRFSDRTSKDTSSAPESSKSGSDFSISEGSPDAASDWPMFRGNRTQTGMATSTLRGELKQRWKFKTREAIEGTPAIVDGVVYVGSFDEHVYAIDLKSGTENWRYKADNKPAGFRASPAVHAGRVHIGDVNGVFHCIDAAKGTNLWTFKTKGEISSCANFAGRLILFGSGDEFLHCLTSDGAEHWTFQVPGGPVMASPAVVMGSTFVSGCDSTLHVIDIATGKETASLDLGSQTGATPAVMGETLYVGTMGTQFLAVNWRKPELRWTFEDEDGGAPFFSSPAVTDKLVLVGSRDRFLYALDRKDGKKVWSFTTDGDVDSSPVVAGNRVYFGSLDRNLYVLDLENGTLLQKITLDGKILGSPAIADGCLLIGTDKGTLYCFNAAEK